MTELAKEWYRMPLLDMAQERRNCCVEMEHRMIEEKMVWLLGKLVYRINP